MTVKKPTVIPYDVAIHIASGEYLTNRVPMAAFDNGGWGDAKLHKYIYNNVLEIHEEALADEIWQEINSLAGELRAVSKHTLDGTYAKGDNDA